MPETGLSRDKWRKSSYISQDGDCVEVAVNLPEFLAARDSEHPAGPTA